MKKALIKDFLNALLNSTKMVKLYPKNNPVRSNAIDKLFVKIANVLEHTGDIILQIEPKALLSDGEPVYQSHEQQNNFAFLLFKEGLRELIFKIGVTREELEEFLDILSSDEKGLVHDDLVSLLWDRDFQNIRYIVDERVISDDDGYSSKAMQKILEQPTLQDNIMAAYKDAFAAEDIRSIEVELPLESDFDDLRIQIERDSEITLYKIINIIFEMYFQAKNKDELAEITSIMKSLMGYLANHDDMESLIDILKKR